MSKCYSIYRNIVILLRTSAIVIHMLAVFYCIPLRSTTFYYVPHILLCFNYVPLMEDRR